MKFEDSIYGTIQTNDYSSGFLNAGIQTLVNSSSVNSQWYKEVKSEKKEIKMGMNKRGLYQVILVNPKESKIIFNGFVICDKVEDVLLEADAGKVIKESGLQVSEVDKIVNFMGEIRKSRKNKDGIIELVSEEQK